MLRCAMGISACAAAVGIRNRLRFLGRASLASLVRHHTSVAWLKQYSTTSSASGTVGSLLTHGGFADVVNKGIWRTRFGVQQHEAVPCREIYKQPLMPILMSASYSGIVLLKQRKAALRH